MSKIQFIANPMLISAMELIKKDKSLSSYKVFIDEMKHATFLSPVIVSKAPVNPEEGEGNRITAPMLTGADGKRYFMAFTDVTELNKIKKDKKASLNVIPADFKDYAVMVAKADENCNGFIINPFSNGPMVGKELIAKIVQDSVQRQMDKEQENAAEQTAEEGTAEE